MNANLCLHRGWAGNPQLGIVVLFVFHIVYIVFMFTFECIVWCGAGNPQLAVTGAFCLPLLLPNFMQEEGDLEYIQIYKTFNLQFIRIYDLIKKIRCIQCHSIGCLCQHSKLRFFVNKHLESRSKAKYNRVSLCRERFRDVQGEVGV